MFEARIEDGDAATDEQEESAPVDEVVAEELKQNDAVVSSPFDLIAPLRTALVVDTDEGEEVIASGLPAMKLRIEPLTAELPGT